MKKPETKLTPEQTLALKKLYQKDQWYGVFAGVKFVFLVFLTTVLIGLVNVKMEINSEDFYNSACLMNSIYLTVVFFRNSRKHHDRVKEEVAKILKQ